MVKDYLFSFRLCVLSSAYSNTVSKFIEMVKNLAYDETPNYVKLKSILKDGLTKAGQKNEWIINFTSETKVHDDSRLQFSLFVWQFFPNFIKTSHSWMMSKMQINHISFMWKILQIGHKVAVIYFRRLNFNHEKIPFELSIRRQK